MLKILIAALMIQFSSSAVNAEEPLSENIYKDRLTIFELKTCYEMIKRKEQEKKMLSFWILTLPGEPGSLSRQEFSDFYRQDEAIVKKEFRQLHAKPAKEFEGDALAQYCINLEKTVQPILERLKFLHHSGSLQ